MNRGGQVLPERAHGGKLTFREYSKKDLQRCVEITVQAWPELKEGGLDIATMEWYGWPATWKDVACVSDVPVGILFAKIHRDQKRLRGSLAHATVYTKMLLGLYGKTPHRLASVRGGIAGDRDTAKNAPDVDGEITYLVIDSAYRGKGIGKELLRRFLEHAKERSARRISVYTTDPGSDWQFYGTQGFKLYSEFRDGFMSVIRNEDVKAMFYILEIKDNKIYHDDRPG